MKTEFIVSVIAAVKRTTDYEPSETAYFTFVEDDMYPAHRLPDPWVFSGQSPRGIPCRKAVTISLPDYITKDGLFLRSAYNAHDGNVDIVLISCDPIRVGGSIESAIDAAIKTITVSAPTKPGKRENIPFTIESVTSLFCDTHPNEVE